MVDELLEAGSQWLAGLSTKVIAYSRGSESIDITATPGTTDLQVVDTGGFVTSFHAADFIFPTAALDFGAGAVEPAVGDRITWKGCIYEVQNVPGARHFRYTDPDRTAIRVHTKLIEG